MEGGKREGDSVAGERSPDGGHYEDQPITSTLVGSG